MALRKVGFFRELRHGFPDGPSLKAVRGTLKEVGAVAKYLRSGNAVVTPGVLVDDVLDPTKTRVAPLWILTDGAWVWPADLAYYVETYSCGLPQEFLDHMRGVRWRMVTLSDEDLARVCVELRAGKLE